MNKYDNLDTFRMDDIICPYCKYIFKDSWEFNTDWSEDLECYECGRKFGMERITEVKYTTFKLKE